jgi:hypothetical protein
VTTIQQNRIFIPAVFDEVPKSRGYYVEELATYEIGETRVYDCTWNHTQKQCSGQANFHSRGFLYGMTVRTRHDNQGVHITRLS